MSSFEFSDLPSQFRQLLGKCRDLYVSSAEQAVREHADLAGETGDKFLQLMDDLHRALAVKVFVTVCEADRRWSKNEKFLAEVLLYHLWNQWLDEDGLRAAIMDMSEKALQLKWYALVRPFDQIAPLRNRVGELESLVVRLANVVARADGPLKDAEAAQIKSIQLELRLHLRSIPIDEADHAEAEHAGSQAIEKIFDTANQLPATRQPPRDDQRLAPPRQQSASDKPGTAKEAIATAAAEEPKPAKTPAQLLAYAIGELDKLIGLATVKDEIRTLANFLKVQAKRTAAGLPATPLSLHTVYGGNPGTGKTSVARIVGKVFGAMGVLKKGHLVETDRSGLVAEFAGQTGPKTNKKIDEALDGVLFIDEAYTLIASEGEDPYGHEAVQTLLKRMEDDRDRLVVVLAGYPVEMQMLLRSNPGLSSRFSRQLNFPDYAPLELAQIFGQMSQKSRYLLGGPLRAKLMLGLTWLYERRDRSFGNGRTVRNLFEDAIRRQANRIASISELSVEQLSILEPADVNFADCPPDTFACVDKGDVRFRIACIHCQHAKDVPEQFLGQKLHCPKCGLEFTAEWGEVTAAQPTTGQGAAVAPTS